ncbi:histidine kinase [Glycomyces scopariae]|uniref:histidine kinase n=1 Tax=Glycomyces sambucus TaxID=380244 RepID=A0A1G9K7M1_9ACTN|nr:histidine kinase [Glycomyces sambucus]SDL45546.1 Signal transduction histidine kinase [Glycomyces sambucus]
MQGERRGARGWAADAALFAFGVFAWLYLSADRMRLGLPSPPWLFELDQLAGVLALGLLWLRRRWPTQAAAVAAGLSSFSETSAFPLLVLLFTVVVRRPLRTAAWVFGGAMAAAVVYSVIRPQELGVLGNLAFAVVLYGGVAGWGMFTRYRRALRARAAEQEQGERERARQRAREELARELHDLLGHRLSLLSLHAGAMEYRTDLTPRELAGAAGVVREQSHLAMRDLREVIAVLRAPIGELPQPSVADLRALVEEARPGSEIAFEVAFDPEAAGEAPERSGRTAYRIVQEALTNARRHAEGAAVAVTVSGGPGDGLEVAVVNGPGRDSGAGSGHGLIGLEERTALAGGRLDYGPTGDGGWRVRAWLPWTA